MAEVYLKANNLNSRINPCNPKRERESGRIAEEQKQRENIWGKREALIYLGGGKKSVLLEGTQSMPARPSDKDKCECNESVSVRMVSGKSVRQRGILFL
jgi:hypothetical protein